MTPSPRLQTCEEEMSGCASWCLRGRYYGDGITGSLDSVGDLMRRMGPGLLMDPRWALATFITLHSEERRGGKRRGEE